MGGKAEVDFSNIRRKPWLVDQLPWVGRGTGTTLYPYVWLSRKIYDDLQTAKPSPYNVALVIHEQEHLARIRKYGWFKWGYRYIFDRKFRFDEELAATKPQFAYIKGAGLPYNLERKAKMMSGWLYFWPLSYTEALARVSKLWQSS